ncbi:Alb1-domain-containing protein [Hypoxylon cercidicola]|nr:Alb1-domain-containing protein [Hypoxylon cercidicola]
MAKGGIVKKKKAPSLHSRSARRATSPSIDTDKSLKNVQPPAESVDHRPSVLSIHHGAGVSKKTKKGRNLSSKARKRFEKGQDRAAAIMERTEHKVAKSKGQARTMQSRRKAWDDINNQIPSNKKKPQDEANDEEDAASELDEDMGDAQVQVEKAFEGVAATDKALLQEEEEEEDGIL